MRNKLAEILRQFVRLLMEEHARAKLTSDMELEQQVREFREQAARDHILVSCKIAEWEAAADVFISAGQTPTQVAKALAEMNHLPVQ